MRSTFNGWLSLVLAVAVAVLGGAGSAVAQDRGGGNGGSPDTGGSPTAGSFQVGLWVDKGAGASYGVGELLLISVRASQDALVTLRERFPDGMDQARLTDLAVRGGVTSTIQTTVAEPAGPRLLILEAAAGAARARAECGFTVVPATAPRQDDHKCGADLIVGLVGPNLEEKKPWAIAPGTALTFRLGVGNPGKEDLVNVHWETSVEVDQATYNAYQARMPWRWGFRQPIAADDGITIKVQSSFLDVDHRNHFYVEFSGTIDLLKAGANQTFKLPAVAKKGEAAIPSITPQVGDYAVGARAQGTAATCSRLLLAVDNTLYKVK